MTKYYPVCLNLNDKTCLVFGGGKVAERKALGLLEVGANVVIVAPFLTDNLEGLRDESRLAHVAREYRDGDVAQAFLAIAATDDERANEAIAAEARRLGILVNVVDDIEHSEFTLPSVLRRGDLTIAVSTNGRSPAVSRWVREQLEGSVTEHQMLLDLAGEVRASLRARGESVSWESWKGAIDDELLALIRQGDLEEARASLVARLNANAAVPGSEGD